MAVIRGTSGNNTLNGTPGNDTIIGDAGTDIMAGGLGNDTYYVDDPGDQVIEIADQGFDKVYSSINYTLPAGQSIEYLGVYGSAGLTLTGDAFGNILVGGSGSDTLNGDAGDDRLNGGAANDSMSGGLGNDIYYVDSEGDQVTEGVGQGTDTVFSSFSYTLSAGQEVESLRAYGSAGLTLTGNEFSHTIVGGTGNDTLNAGNGDDRLTGGAGDDTLNGGGGNDSLIGGAGTDIMSGGLGNDTYYIDDAADQVIEAAGQGTDTIISSVSYVLVAGQEVEYLRVRGSAGLMLTGNDLDNILVGGSGDDLLDGGTGNDQIFGGDGNDTISTTGQSAIIRAGNGNDSIRLDGSSTSTGTVDGGAGNDTVHSTDLGQFVIRNVETLDTYYGFFTGSVAQIASFGAYTAVLSGAPDTQISFSLRGAGGALDFTTGISGQNSVEIRDSGITSAIQITGSVNNDTMFGSVFDDTLNGGNGQDTLFGNEGIDTLNGGAGNDLLNGGVGNDTMTGGAGNDTFAFDTPFEGGGNIDLVADFAPGSDIIQLDQTYYFAGLSLGQLAAAQFATGSATGTGPQIVYNQTTGALFYDNNGADPGGANQFATLTGSPVLTAANFQVV